MLSACRSLGRCRGANGSPFIQAAPFPLIASVYSTRCLSTCRHNSSNSINTNNNSNSSITRNQNHNGNNVHAAEAAAHRGNAAGSSVARHASSPLSLSHSLPPYNRFPAIRPTVSAAVTGASCIVTVAAAAAAGGGVVRGSASALAGSLLPSPLVMRVRCCSTGGPSDGSGKKTGVGAGAGAGAPNTEGKTAAAAGAEGGGVKAPSTADTTSSAGGENGMSKQEKTTKEGKENAADAKETTTDTKSGDNDNNTSSSSSSNGNGKQDATSSTSSNNKTSASPAPTAPPPRSNNNNNNNNNSSKSSSSKVPKGFEGFHAPFIASLMTPPGSDPNADSAAEGGTAARATPKERAANSLTASALEEKLMDRLESRRRASSAEKILRVFLVLLIAFFCKQLMDLAALLFKSAYASIDPEYANRSGGADGEGDGNGSGNGGAAADPTKEYHKVIVDVPSHTAQYISEDGRVLHTTKFLDYSAFERECDPGKDIIVTYHLYYPWLPMMLLCLLPVLAMINAGYSTIARNAFSRTALEGRAEAGKKSRFRFERQMNVRTRLGDVAGLTEAKAEVVEVIDFLKQPQRYVALGAKLPKGVLLDGPPGVGKTLLAKAIAGEATLPFVSCSGSEFEEEYVGVGAQRVRELFREAHRCKPCVVFIDEIDAFGRKRRSDGGGSSRGTLNAFLAALDGFKDASGIMVLAATNRADILDPALTRSGRFDRKITLERPPHKDRVAIAAVHLAPLRLEGSAVSSSSAQQGTAATAAAEGGDSAASTTTTTTTTTDNDTSDNNNNSNKSAAAASSSSSVAPFSSLFSSSAEKASDGESKEGEGKTSKEDGSGTAAEGTQGSDHTAQDSSSSNNSNNNNKTNDVSASTQNKTKNKNTNNKNKNKNSEKVIAEFAEMLAALTAGCSGADIFNVCNEAAIQAAREGSPVVCARHFHAAADRVLVGLEKAAVRYTPIERERLAYHEAGAVVLTWFQTLTDPVIKTTILPRGQHRTGVTQTLPQNIYISTQERLRQGVIARLGGYVSEEYFFEDVSSGAAEDLQRATEAARRMVTVYGMDPEHIGHIGYDLDRSDAITKPFGPKKEDAVDAAVEREMQTALAAARALLREHHAAVRAVAGTLLKQDTIDAHGLWLLLGPRPVMSKEFLMYLES